MKNLTIFFIFLMGFAAKAQLANQNALIVPEFNNGKIKTYFSTGTSTIAVNANYTIDLTTLPNGLATQGSPNALAMFGNDLFVTITKANQRVYKFPNYGNNPTQAIANVSQITNQSSDYVGLAFDAVGNLYVSEGAWGDTTIFKYTASSNYATRINLGNGGINSYFGNIAFDASGNLWASDYWNSRIIVIKATDLSTINAPFRSFYTNNVSWNTNGGHNENLNAVLAAKAITKVFSQPEGVAFDNAGRLWVANNNDSGHNGAPTLVRISTVQQATILALPPNGSINADPNMSNSINGFQIWNLPTTNPVVAGTGQLGGMQIDKAINRIYVNDQNNGAGIWLDIAAINAVTDNFDVHKLNITSTNPGNGGIYLASSSQVLSNKNIEKTDSLLTIYPNPFSEIFSINTPENITKIDAFDISGKQVPVTQYLNNQYAINNNQSTSGFYVLKIQLDNNNTITKTIIKK